LIISLSILFSLTSSLLISSCLSILFVDILLFLSCLWEQLSGFFLRFHESLKIW
jgi:hypothetical protein